MNMLKKLFGFDPARTTIRTVNSCRRNRAGTYHGGIDDAALLLNFKRHPDRNDRIRADQPRMWQVQETDPDDVHPRGSVHTEIYIHLMKRSY